MSSTPDPGTARPFLPAHLSMFGYEPTPVELDLLPRNRRWRTFRTGRLVALTMIVAPMVALVPPHAPWLIGALVGGTVLARRQWRHRHTIVTMSGPCPRCGNTLSIATLTRLEPRHAVSCDACRHEAVLLVDPSHLESETVDQPSTSP